MDDGDDGRDGLDTNRTAGSMADLNAGEDDDTGDEEYHKGNTEDGFEGEVEEQVSPEDAWLFDLNDRQLLQLADQDETRCTAREAAGMKAGMDPYSEVTSPIHQSATSAAGRQGPLSQMAAAPESSSAASQPLPAASDGEEWQDAYLEGGDEEEGDEWVDLSEEEMELLDCMDEYEASPAQGVGSVRDGEDEASGENQEGPLEDADRWLLDLTEEELMDLVDK